MIPALPLEHLQSPPAIAAYVMVVVVLAAATIVRLAITQRGKAMILAAELRQKNEQQAAELKAKDDEASRAAWEHRLASERMALNESNERLVERLMKRESDAVHERNNLLQRVAAMEAKSASCERDNMRLRQNVMGLMAYVSQLSGILAAHSIMCPVMPFPLAGALPDGVDQDRRVPAEGN